LVRRHFYRRGVFHRDRFRLHLLRRHGRSEVKKIVYRMSEILFAAEIAIRREIVSMGTRGKPTSLVYGGRPMTWRKKQAGALHGTGVTGAQAPREGFPEITSGRFRWQQGLIATCRDSSTKIHWGFAEYSWTVKREGVCKLIKEWLLR